MVYYPSYRVKKRFGNFNKQICPKKSQYSCAILTVGEQYQTSIAFVAGVPTPQYSITFESAVPNGSDVVYNSKLITQVKKHDEFKKSTMKNFSSACSSNVGSANNIQFEESKVTVEFNNALTSIQVFNYDKTNPFNNGWNCYEIIIINGKLYKLLDIKFI